jgi:hypothetical protein
VKVDIKKVAPFLACAGVLPGSSLNLSGSIRPADFKLFENLGKNPAPIGLSGGLDIF